MSQLIIDSLLQRLEDEIPISALLTVSPGFKRALTPWFITKSGTTVREPMKELPPHEFLSLKMIKFLHAVSPFTFQFATALSIKVENEQELNEVISSDAAKSLFKQAHTLRLHSPTVYNPEDLIQFIQQFGLLKSCRVYFSSKNRTDEKESMKQTSDFFCQILSSAVITRNCDLTVSLVASLQNHYYDCRWYGDDDTSFDDTIYNNRTISILCDLSVNCYKNDNGSSLLNFVNCFDYIFQKRRFYDRENFSSDAYMLHIPFFNLLDSIVQSGTFKRVVVLSSTKTEATRKKTKSFVDDDTQMEFDVVSKILSMFDWICRWKDAFTFVERYGRSLLCNLSQIIFDYHLHEISKGRYDPPEFWDNVFCTFCSLITTNWNEKDTTNTNTNPDKFCADLFPFATFCKFIDNADYSAGYDIAKTFTALAEAIKNPGGSSALRTHHQQSLFDVTRKIFKYLSRFNFRETLQLNELLVDLQGGDDGMKEVLRPLMEGLSTMLFPSSKPNDAFHENMRAAVFDTQNPIMHNAVIRWGRAMVKDLEGYLRDHHCGTKKNGKPKIQHDYDGIYDWGSECLSGSDFRSPFTGYSSFIEKYVPKFLEKILTYSEKHKDNQSQEKFVKLLTAVIADIKRLAF